MVKASVKLGEVNGIEFRISIGWVIILIVLIASLQNPQGYNEYFELVNLLTLGHVTLNPAFPESQIAMLAFTITVLLGVYASVILHEIGHATAARNRGINVKSIKLWIAGGVAKIESIPPTKEYPITIAGPAVTATLVPAYAIISAILFTLNITTIAWIFLLLALFNFLMFLFNLLPLFPLDGGRILRAKLTQKTSYKNATKYAFYATITVTTTAIILMFTFNYYDYLFISTIILLLSYSNYKTFKLTHNPTNVTRPDDFHIYEQTFAFDSETVTTEEKQTLTNYIHKHGGHTTQNRTEADLFVTAQPLQSDTPATPINPLQLTRKIERNGSNIPPEFKNLFKL